MAYSVSRSSDGLSIVVPRRFDPFLFAFFPIWTAWWIGLAVKGYRSGADQSVSSLLGLTFFGLVTLSLLYAWLWNIGGSEELHFTIVAVQHRRVLFGMGYTRWFRLTLISNPHFVRSVRGRRSRTPSGFGFFYRGKEVRVGDNLTQQEAKEIAHLLVNQFPDVATLRSQYAEGVPEPDEPLRLKLT
jgi:hypothetical protein